MKRKYKIIYADPPWTYRVWNKKGKGRTAVHHYQTQATNDLAKMDIEEISDKDAALFMWVTFPLLNDGLLLGKAWGFQYKTVAFVWIKQNKNNDRLFLGMGHYTRANAEIVLLFTKGKSLKRCARNVAQVVISKIGRHSQKPAEIRNRIVRLFGALPRIELFARKNPEMFLDDEYKGWDVFGNDVPNSISLKNRR